MYGCKINTSRYLTPTLYNMINFLRLSLLKKYIISIVYFLIKVFIIKFFIKGRFKII